MRGRSESDVDNEKKSVPAATLYSQWSAGPGGSFFCPTREPFGCALPDGAYSIVVTPSGLAFNRESVRNDDLVVAEGQVSALLDEVGQFWGREYLYRTFKVPYRRGILLHGAPGCGKTTLVRLLLRDIEQRFGVGFVINGSRALSTFATNGYQAFRQIQPDTPLVVVIEDVDKIIGDGCEEQLLELLDGVGQGVDRVVFVATTNYLNKLPSRVLRPSRFDKKILIGAPRAKARRLFLRKFFDLAINDVKTEIASRQRPPISQWVTRTKGLTFADLKELFVSVVVIGADFDAALKCLSTITVDNEIDDDDEPDVERGQARESA
jgi:SpoVK/Ycf46/Vps4 family AAA+-type ATPase